MMLEDENEMEGENVEQEDFTGEELIQNIDENLHNINSELEEENDDANWTTVGREKRRKVEKIDICISSIEKLPKQFALAKLLHSENILGIDRVKYINPFKVVISFNDILRAEKLLICQHFKDKGWRLQKTWEVNSSFGIIKNIDLELSEEELLKCIQECNEPSEILGVKRLSRRCSESGWIQSETVRICFKGNNLPAFIKMFNLRVAVEPYVFPVTQCSRCWRFGHTIKLCPSLKVICPKCGNNHNNCEATTYNCVNCKGPHMALVKSCPAYIKEKKIRSLMAEFNCTYRRALTMYVPPFSPQHNPSVMNRQYQPFSSVSYAMAVKQNDRHHILQNKNISTDHHMQERIKRKQPNVSIPEGEICIDRNLSLSLETIAPHTMHIETAVADVHTVNERGASDRRDCNEDYFNKLPIPDKINDMNVTSKNDCGSHKLSDSNLNSECKTFKDLISKIFNIIFSKQISTAEKTQKVIGSILEWCISKILNNFSDASTLNKIFDITFNSSNG